MVEGITFAHIIGGIIVVAILAGGSMLVTARGKNKAEAMRNLSEKLKK